MWKGTLGGPDTLPQQMLVILSFVWSLMSMEDFSHDYVANVMTLISMLSISKTFCSENIFWFQNFESGIIFC